MHTSIYDALGNIATLIDPASLGSLNNFVEGFTACGERAEHRPEPSTLLQACCAALDNEDTPREQRFVKAVAT